MSRRRRVYVRLLPTIAIAIVTVAVALLAVLSSGDARPRRVQSSRTPSQRAAQHPASRPQATRPATPLPGTRSAGSASSSTATRDTASHDVDRMLGQMIVARFQGRQPTKRFLSRIRSGQIGGVILFADNLAGGVTRGRALTTELQRAARQGGNPPLLIMTDQEGGMVRRIAGPPDLAPSAMTSDRAAFGQGAAAGRLLRAAGINLDLAPVTDVKHSFDSFLGNRSFGTDPSVVASRACSFAHGLQSQGIGYTLKHFPGLGMATGNTDRGRVSVNATADALRADYLPYVSCAHSPSALVMVSSAAYRNLSGPLPAVMSPLTYRRELSIIAPHGRVPTISDDLQAAALSNQPHAAQRAIDAGLDLALFARTEQASADAYHTLAAEVRDGKVSPARIRSANLAVQRLKRTLART